MEAAADPDNAVDLARLVTIRGHPSPPGVLLVADTEEDVLVRAPWRGVRGLILGGGARDLLVPAVRLVAAKYLVVPLSLSRRVLEDWVPGRLSDDPSHAILNVLTPRELDVLELVARGRSNAQISSELRLTESTVKSYLQRILGKLKVRNRVGVVILARELGLV
jgi:DNA-binding NarL/FixJ family response regulator